ncbi:MAG TPA: MalY/PatB family protein [Syntrophomonadaceae bacterium]|nr:MalY/PatB family protein [Syntrophomonadaceae bacterium]
MYNFDKIVSRRHTNCAKWDEVGEDLLPMWVADMDFQSPPEVIAALEERVRHGIFGYSGGYEGWDTAFIQWMKRRFGWQVDREWITTSPGVVPALDMLIRALTEPGDGVVIQPPVYCPFFAVVRNNGRKLLENPLIYDGCKYRMDLDNLERQLNPGVKLLILCSPHNPVGRMWEPRELAALGDICLEHGIRVISDEIHADLVFPGQRHTVFASLSSELEQNCAICTAPSKTFNIAGIQASNITIPNPEIRSAYRQVLNTGELGLPNVFAIAAAEAAYTQGEAWLDEMMIYVRDNFKYLQKFMAENIPRIKIIEPEATYLVWLDCRSLGMNNQQLDRFIRDQARLVLSPGHIFGSAGSGFQRMNIACPRAILEEALRRLESAVGDLSHVNTRE